jgi:hypothetical protein
MRVDNIELSPEAAGVLSAITSSWQVSACTGRRFRFGPSADPYYQELVKAGFVSATPILNNTRYELLRDVTVPEPVFSHQAKSCNVSISLTDVQREMLAQERMNNKEISRAIANGTHKNSKFSDRCLGDYVS